ncbi:transient receptor potential cation channel subfamily M member 6-like [Paramuricea clavata]|uniref:Transient receptor potential cation channel subfamily M member 6-like n=1 Tax=Paramuricea clavata TaxID=317549 RepID=A0A6S7HK62_PARCT|nr:transient receptor potential cation channel subfamily M member 6-like [Paramuricea clavata]
MKSKRSKDQRVKKTGSAPHELIVQRLAAEPDHKQTYKAVQFVAYESLRVQNGNIKKEIIKRDIFYHSDVYLVRFMVTEQLGDGYPDSPEVSEPKDVVFSQPINVKKFHLDEQEWVSLENSLDLLVDAEKFSSGGFRDAFLGVTKDKEKWVIKKYHERAVNTITGTLNSTVEDHTHKQVQIHSVARHLTKVFSNKVPQEFGECFTFNRAYYTVYQGQPATVEEFVEGTFRKYVNNNGKVCRPEVCSAEVMTIIEKAECLVHYSHIQSSKKLMLVDLQGAGYHLYEL